MIIAAVTIDNITANVVIDTGASASFLPGEGTILQESKPSLMRTQTDTRIADNGRLDCTHLVYSQVCLWAGRLRKHSARFLVINKSKHILGYDALFGTDTIKALGISISQKKGTLWAEIDGHLIGSEDTEEKYYQHLGLIKRLQETPPANTPIDRLLRRYDGIFSEIAEGVMNTRSMEIQLTSNNMPKARLRKYSVEDIAEIDRQVKSMLERDIIEPSVSSFSSTCHLVPKKTGQRRLVINYIPLNKIAVKDHYPLPQISDLLAHLADAKYFCALDCTEGFWQIPVHPDDRPKTAFVTPQGLYQFKRCPFGFTNSPAIFQRAMNEIFREGLYKRCVIYIDDILVFGQTEEDVLSNLEWVFRKCDEANVKLKLSKCEFLKTHVKFLGYKIGQGNILPLTEKCIPWIEQKPSTVKEAQALLGYINYYSRFVQDFSEKTNVIRRAIRLQPFEWTEECQNAKDLLLSDIQSATSQVIPSASTPKQIEIAVLDNSIEAACLTEDGQLIMRTSAVLSSTQKNYSMLEKELLALVRAYNKFGPFLRGIVTVKTSCTLLAHALRLKDKPERVARLLLQLPPDAQFNVQASNDVLETTQRMSEPPEETFYTDGAFQSKDSKEPLASWAVVAVNKPELSCSGVLENSTNQKAEVEAVIKACQIAKATGLKTILVVTDSKYVADAVNKWIDRWESNGWLDNKNKPVKNEEAFKRLSKAKEDLSLTIAHVRGHQGDKYNELADKMAKEALLERFELCATIYSPPEMFQDEDPELKKLKETLKKGGVVGKYYLKGDSLWLATEEADKLVVPSKQRHLLLQLAHSDPLYGAHFGIKKTRKKLKNYHWQGIGADVNSFVASCETCQKHKQSKQKVYGKLRPIKTSNLFNRVHMDIVGPMTASEKDNKFIITAIDAFSRMGVARPCSSVPTADDVIALLRDEIIYRHGPPENIVTDNGTQFKATRFLTLLESLGIKHSTTCEYNPQANGMDEKFNDTLVRIIRNIVGTNKRRWDESLPIALLAYNLTPNESTGLSPYTIVYGRWPRSPLNPIELEKEVGDIPHDEIREYAGSNVQQAQEQMAQQYDKNKRDIEFKPLDLVMVKTLSIGRTDSKKFSPKYTGPHSILRLLKHDGKPMAVEILDSDTCRVRRVPFSAIKDYFPPKGTLETDLPGEILALNLARHARLDYSLENTGHMLHTPRERPLALTAGAPSPKAIACEHESCSSASVLPAALGTTGEDASSGPAALGTTGEDASSPGLMGRTPMDPCNGTVGLEGASASVSQVGCFPTGDHMGVNPMGLSSSIGGPKGVHPSAGHASENARGDHMGVNPMDLNDAVDLEDGNPLASQVGCFPTGDHAGGSPAGLNGYRSEKKNLLLEDENPRSSSNSPQPPTPSTLSCATPTRKTNNEESSSQRSEDELRREPEQAGTTQ